MAWGDAYATAAEYRAQISKTDSADDTEILRNLKAVSLGIIDVECGRHFNRDATATTRVYLPDDCYSLSIADMVSVSEVIADLNDDQLFTDDAVDSATYELYPFDAATSKGEAWPYTELRRIGGEQWTLPYRIRVSGIHGWPAVPAAVKEATIQLTAILRLETPRATTTVDELSRLVGTSRAANEIVERLKSGYGKSPALGSFYLV